MRLNPILFIIAALAAALVLTNQQIISPVSAAFTSNQGNPSNTFATANLVAPTNLTASASGHDVALSWSAGQNGTGYAINGVANGTSSNCSAVTFSAVGTTAATSFTDANRFSPQGNYFCYQAVTTRGSWTSTSSNPTVAAQIGFVATTVQMINGGVAGRLDPGDQIVIQFNQAVNTSTGPASTDTVCAWGSSILLASANTAFGCGPQGVQSGSYTGNGADNRAITGLSFTPDVLIIKDTSTDIAVIRTSTISGDASKPLVGNTGFQSNRIQSLDDFGFTIGNDATVNTNGNTYHWIAFKAAQGEMVVGSYTGNGVDNRNITGVGFQPDLVFVFAESNRKALYRPSSLTGDQTFQFDKASAAANIIQSFISDGFQVGTDNQVNASGIVYHYAAWKNISGKTNNGTYTGNGADNRNITGTGFQPEYLIVNDSGGGTNVHKPASTGSSTDTSLFFTADSAATNRIQQLQSNGFQVGTDATVNTSGSTYYWTAFANLVPASPASESVSIGTLTGGTISGCNCRFNATYAWSNGNKTLTITIGTRIAGYSNPTISAATWTFTPTTTASKLQSATGGFHICDNNSGGGNCLPATTILP